MNQPKFSIIIPVKKINDYIRESTTYINNLEYEQFEILILTDKPEKVDFEKAQVIHTGAVGPATKRDIGSEHASGEILAFLDDDAYPRADWLKNAARHFEQEEIAAVGGPAVTPDSNSLLQKASGLVFSSLMGGGKVTYRYLPGKLQEVDDFPSVNLFVRKSVFEEIGGFDSHYWPGEDTKLCLDITKQGKIILYDPEVFVWHHRRTLFKAHMKQVWNYAQHRGLFAKKLPETSRRLTYFIPSFFVLFVVLGGVLSLLSPTVKIIWQAILLIYGLGLIATGLSTKKVSLGLLVMLGIIVTHITYGLGLIKGLLAKELSKKY